MTATPLNISPDRLLPAEPSIRKIARELYDSVKDLPIISPHGHVPPSWFSENTPFSNPTELLLTPDHYVNRLLHANGVQLSTMGVPVGSPLSEEGAREAFRTFCRNWKAYRGTPMKFWFEAELADVFDIDLRPSEETADEIYDRIDALLKTDAYRPRELYDRFNISFIATTDDPCDDLEQHNAIKNDESWDGIVVPTFRPDKYLEPLKDTWNADVDRLAEVSGVDTGDYAGYIAAMENRRAFFKANGAVSTDHSHFDAGAVKLDDAEAESLYAAARAGSISVEDANRLRRDFVFQQARMASEDGLVMTIHPAVARSHHEPTFEKYGADVGCDFPVTVEFVSALKPMLNAFGTNPNFQLVVFTMDETTFSRELGPMASFYPSVYVGAPWWFIDTPDAIARYRSAVTESCGFGKTSGMIDDTRALLSIPARHDMARRMDSGYLAGLVADHRLSMDEALDTAFDLVDTQPKKAFRL
ncbi:MAG TPA: glucuronate isomerase [Actinomycetaceae bacterium]|nr:glucuronate isomerase [Actinomycetaceae bacterium]